MKLFCILGLGICFGTIDLIGKLLRALRSRLVHSSKGELLDHNETPGLSPELEAHAKSQVEQLRRKRLQRGGPSIERLIDGSA